MTGLIRRRASIFSILVVALVVPRVAYSQTGQVELSPFTRLTLGVEQSAASAADSRASYNADFFLSAPVWFTAKHTCGYDSRTKDEKARKVPPSQYCVVPRAMLFGQLGSLGVSDTVGVPIKDASGTLDASSTTTINQLFQGLRFRVGGELTVWLSDGWGEEEHDHIRTKTHAAVMLIGDLGGSTPLSANDRVQYFKYDNSVSQQLIELFDHGRLPDVYSDLVGKDNSDPQHPNRTVGTTASSIDTLAFIGPDRTRFFRNWSVGFRVKSYDIKASGTAHEITGTRGMLDLTWGRDDEIIARKDGKMQGAVARLDGFYKVPGVNIYAFGNMRWGFAGNGSQNVESAPLLMKPSAIPADLTKVRVVPIGQIGRDVWRFGLAVDLLKAFRGVTN